MGGCAAPNCRNRSNKGFKMYRFPADPERRKKWLINCRRAEWKPTQSDCLCSAHFEESQFEQHRADGKRLLSPIAVPTLFSVPNPPKKLDGTRKSVYKRPHPINRTAEFSSSKRVKLESEFPEDPLAGTSQQTNDETHVAIDEVALLKSRIVELEGTLKRQNESLSTFLTQEQIEKLQIEKKCIKKWSSEAIVKSLKLRFALGKNGYNFLRETGYPTPSDSTLNKRVLSVKVAFGVSQCVMELLAEKS